MSHPAVSAAQISSMVTVCMKWTSRIGSDPTHLGDDRFAGVSAADQAALETGLAIAEALGLDLVALTVGPAGADQILREAVASGAASAIRVDAPTAISSAEVARQLARHIDASGVVVCGDYSSDRGTGSVPAFLAHRLGVQQALGLIGLDLSGLAGPDQPDAARSMRAVRRLDGGRREILTVSLPCVVSVEGSVATLRRASLRAALSARSAAIEIAPMATFIAQPATPVVTPYRPRARALPPPAGAAVLDRLRALTDAATADAHGETVTLDPPAAAARIVATLRAWGHLPT